MTGETLPTIVIAAAGIGLIAGALIVSLAGLAAERAGAAHFFRVLLTEDDADRVWCWARVSAFIGLIAFLVFCAVDLVVNRNAFNPLAFGGGLGAVIAAGGAALRLKGNL